jgi:hypothetical protein
VAAGYGVGGGNNWVARLPAAERITGLRDATRSGACESFAGEGKPSDWYCDSPATVSTPSVSESSLRSAGSNFSCRAFVEHGASTLRNGLHIGRKMVSGEQAVQMYVLANRFEAMIGDDNKGSAVQ